MKVQESGFDRNLSVQNNDKDNFGKTILKSSGTSSFAAVVHNYYVDIDLAGSGGFDPGKLEKLQDAALSRATAIFDLNGIYVRAGKKYSGLSSIEAFYRTPYPNGRLGLLGSHTILDTLEISKKEIVILGVFVRSDGLAISFADLWQCSNSARPVVSYRETFLLSDEFSLEVEHPTATGILNISNSRLIPFRSSIEVVFGKIQGDEGEWANYLDIIEKNEAQAQMVRRYVSKGHGDLKPANEMESVKSNRGFSAVGNE